MDREKGGGAKSCRDRECLRVGGEGRWLQRCSCINLPSAGTKGVYHLTLQLSPLDYSDWDQFLCVTVNQSLQEADKT